jgi:putative two-component system response regulator
MKTHTTIGRDAIVAAERLLDAPNSFLRLAREIAWSHHERWDGTGYPQGMSGDDILICGRLMAVADVYDALISRRVYKPAFSHEKASSIVMEESGTHFDPDVAEAFLEISGQFRDVAQRYADEEGTA